MQPARKAAISTGKGDKDDRELGGMVLCVVGHGVVHLP